MPIDSIEFFGVNDTINPLTGTIVPKTVDNIYRIQAYGTIPMAVVNTGLIPNTNQFSTSVLQVIDPANGNILKTLTPTVYNAIGVVSTPPTDIQCVMYDVSEWKSCLFLNTDYIGKLLQISMPCDSCSVMGEWMNIVPGTFLGKMWGSEAGSVPKGSWVQCVGPAISLNRYLHPKYYQYVTENIGAVYSVNPNGHPNAPLLNATFLRSLGTYEGQTITTDTKYTDTAQRVFGNLSGSRSYVGQTSQEVRTGFTNADGPFGFDVHDLKSRMATGSVNGSDYNTGLADITFDNSRSVRTSTETRPYSVGQSLYCKVV